MKTKIKKYEDRSPIEFLVLRDKLGFKRYRKTMKRSDKKLRILLALWLKKMEEKEKEDFLFLGYRRRKLNVN